MASIQQKHVIPLEDGEGNIEFTVSLEENLNKELLEGVSWESSLLSMEHQPLCGGVISIIPISTEKRVLYCQSCGLRIGVPTHITTMSELIVYLIVHCGQK